MSVNVKIDYTNWKGVRRKRVVEPLTIEFTASEFHGQEVQWFLIAIDPEDNKTKTFAMKDIHSWEPL